MYYCHECGTVSKDCDHMEVCWEDEYGVSSFFPNRNYGTIAVCEVCGSEEIDEISCDEECEECPYYADCDIDEKKEIA